LLPSTLQLIIGVVVIAVLSIFSVRARVLDMPGALTGALISSASLFAGGLSWLVIIIAFVMMGSLLTRFRYDYKLKLGSAQEKGGRRSWPNAVANGLVGGVIALAEIVSHRPVFAIAYLASIAAAMSDTIATEIGLLSNSKPRLIYNLTRVVTPGVSGGVSRLGELAGMVSALGLGGFGIAIGVFSAHSSEILPALASVVIASFIAMNFDSLLGATVQGMNRCTVCNATTESLHHHGKSTVSVRGIRHLENNMVNLIATLVAAAVGAAIYLVLVP
jgi:uncharacterized protein (TIGR00297 family)